jgi:hypothetical protein
MKQFLWDLVKNALSGLWWFFTEFYGWVWNQISPLITDALSGLGINVSYDFTDQLYSHINFFFPLNEFFAVLTVLFSLWLALFTLKIVLKLIPTIY